jgi:DNA-binding HxlR family transcriptional regulator
MQPSTVVDPTDRLEEAGLVIRPAQSGRPPHQRAFVTPKGQGAQEAIARLHRAARRVPAR